MAYWVGLTGGIGSGKSQVAAAFADAGVPVIDADVISRGLTADNGKALPEIRKQFGAGVFDQEGRLNRAQLRDLVFRRPEAKQQLEALMFPLILSEIKTQQQKYAQAVYGVIDIPLLIERPEFMALISRVAVVDTSEQNQIDRVRRRSSLEDTEIRRIMASQASRKERLLVADDVLPNNGTVQALVDKVGRLHRYYQARFLYLSRVNP
ncbi:dephospho-CoA kinase [Neisseria montereyensis]|uniref:Dephospho-CoA kinase n=1 Tax=Neisseria montereyensis TaxID=2973938 RepID=A0ABT2FE35_9NEIS|nr:dephospho-CoA kinase [Neisseria montereyensis]MCS4534181.1 dephospho-CoA kinase [Neisseria montereyensis]